MIDVHSHLLPGVDDGSPSIEASVPVLERFARDGVTCLVLTPHLAASRAAAAPYERNVEILERLRAAAPRAPELRLGWEILLDEPNVDLRASTLRLGGGGTRAILVEFRRMHVPVRAVDELYRIRSSDVVPVVAHPERYRGCTPATIAQWRAAGAVMQLDTAGLLGTGRTATFARALLDAGLADLVASDNHGDARSLAAAREWLSGVAGEEHADLLTRTNPRRLLDGEPVLPVPPLPRRPRMLGQLRRLFRRR
ncbi:MAG TPA: CpsB/CapC family capsule biosynthesis tyrosine phosphatase [Gemmatimonadaceae bacterium]